MCYAGLCGFYHGINTFGIPIDPKQQEMIEALLGTDYKFIRKQGTAAILAKTLTAAQLDQAEINNSIVCPVIAGE